MSKVAIVSGASKGLGRAIASALSREDFEVEGFSRSSEPSLDVGDSVQVRRFVERVVRMHGRIDALVNNAGFAQKLASVSELSDDVLSETFRTNVFGPFYMMRSVIPVMLKQDSGTIVNIGSKSAVFAVPNLAAYSASKAALVSLTQAAAKELRNTNVLCYVVNPAGINTTMRTHIYGAENAKMQQSPKRVAGIIAELVTKHSINGIPAQHGSSLIIRRNGITTMELQDG